MNSDSSDSRPVPARSEPRPSPARRAVELLLGRDLLTSPAAAAGTAGDPGRSVKLRLALLSFLMLFVELALIRWLGANIIYLSYYSNFVLLGSFLGIGIGFLRARSESISSRGPRSRWPCSRRSCCASRFRSVTPRGRS